MNMTSTHPFLELNQQKLHEECHVVARVESMPGSKEEESRNVTDVTVVEELETLVDVLENPQVSLDVERRNVLLKVVCVLEDS